MVCQQYVNLVPGWCFDPAIARCRRLHLDGFDTMDLMRSLTEQEIIELSALLPGVDVDGITHSDLIKRIDQIENLQAKLKRERQAIT